MRYRIVLKSGREVTFEFSAGAANMVKTYADAMKTDKPGGTIELTNVADVTYAAIAVNEIAVIEQLQ